MSTNTTHPIRPQPPSLTQQLIEHLVRREELSIIGMCIPLATQPTTHWSQEEEVNIGQPVLVRDYVPGLRPVLDMLRSYDFHQEIRVDGMLNEYVNDLWQRNNEIDHFQIVDNCCVPSPETQLVRQSRIVIPDYRCDIAQLTTNILANWVVDSVIGIYRELLRNYQAMCMACSTRPMYTYMEYTLPRVWMSRDMFLIGYCCWIDVNGFVVTDPAIVPASVRSLLYTPSDEYLDDLLPTQPGTPTPVDPARRRITGVSFPGRANRSSR